MDGRRWKPLLELDEKFQIVSGNVQELRAAIGHGADLRIYSQFRHNEHIDTSSDDNQLVEETMDMRATYLIDGRWCGGILTLRQPVQLPSGFGPRPSLSLFLYNEDGTQAVARPFLDGLSPEANQALPPDDIEQMLKYHEFERWDDETNAPCSNFVYDFDTLKYIVHEDWTEVLHHAADGTVISGSLAALHDSFASGAEIKLGIAGLCDDLVPTAGPALKHEVFIQCGSCYYYTRDKLLIAATHPLVRVAPAIPLRYASGNWDYTWLVARTDGQVAQLRYNPYTLLPSRVTTHHALRWFVR